MKITVDKELTTLAQLAKVKEDIKAFKGAYTDGDLLRTFFETTGTDCRWNYDILQVIGEAFPGGVWDDTQFSFKIIAKGFYEFLDIRFFCDSKLEIDTRDFKDICSGDTTGRKMYSINRYILEKK